MRGLRAAFQRLIDYPARFEAANQAQSSAGAEATNAAKQLEEALSHSSPDAGELVHVLEAAVPYLAKQSHPERCPLCESAEKAASLQEAVQTRLKQFTALHAAQRKKTSADLALRSAIEKQASLEAELASASARFEEVRGKRQWSDKISLPVDAAPTTLEAISKWITENAALPNSWLKLESAWHDQEIFVETLRKALNTYRANLLLQKELDVLIPRLKRGHEIVVEERRKFTDGVLGAIATEVGRLYEAVHPGEGLDKISLELDARRRASLEIGASFAGHAKTPPQAYFSQSHLDTLGLCVFLALASMDSSDSTILVLDDVLASVDEPHVDRLIEMLYAEVAKFRHCVITTHYRPWKQKLRWGWLQNGQCQLVELTRWTLVNGLQTIQSIPDVQRLGILLRETPPDPQLVCAKAGVILEATLDFLTDLYECAVPRRANGLYTLGDLLPAVNKKLRSALKVDVLTGTDLAGKPTYITVKLGDILDELTRIAQVRNVFGAHLNALSFELLETDAVEFGLQVQLLAGALICSNTGWPRNSKSGSYWSTAGETRRLHPLKRPA